MASKKHSITSVPNPTTRTVYDRAPQTKTPRTPRREYASLTRFSLFYLSQRTGGFGPVNGGVAQ